MVRQVLYILLVILLTNCDNKPKFKTTGSGLKYRYIERSKDNTVSKIGDVLTVQWQIADNKDSVLYDTKNIPVAIKMELKPSSHKGGSIEDGFAIMHPGDSVIFVLPADSFYTHTRKTHIPQGVEPGSNLTFYVRLVKIQQKKDVEDEWKANEKRRKKREFDRLEAFVKTNNIAIKPENNGLYFIENKAGTGNKAMYGDLVFIHYTGSFINGDVFDSSIERDELFEFRLGSKDVIPGLEEGITRMSEGGKAQLIIPSSLAYGQHGYGEIIPPFTTIIFDVELVEVREYTKFTTE